MTITPTAGPDARAARDATAASDDLDTVEDLSAVMARFRTLAAEGAERMGAAVDLSPGQFAALLAIDEGAVNVSAVAQQCLTHLSNASRTIDSLVRDGLLDRSRDPNDRRSVVLALTDDGTARVARLHTHRDRVMAAALGDISNDDQANLVDLLHRLMAGLEDAILGGGDPA